jgi:hypothetical protein
LAFIPIGTALAMSWRAMKHNTKLTLRTETVRQLTGAQLSRAGGGGGTITQVDPPTGSTGTKMTTMTNDIGASGISGGGAI